MFWQRVQRAQHQAVYQANGQQNGTFGVTVPSVLFDKGKIATLHAARRHSLNLEAASSQKNDYMARQGWQHTRIYRLCTQDAAVRSLLSSTKYR